MNDGLQSAFQIFTIIVIPILTIFSVQSYRISKAQKDFIDTLGTRNDVLFMRVNRIEDEKDAIEKKAIDYRNRVSSLEYDLRVMRGQMVAMETRISETTKQNGQLRRRIRTLMGGINVLMAQIQEHESRPNWQIPEEHESDDTAGSA